jgi:hypothetical protein
VAERGEFELPVPILETSRRQVSVMGFGTARRATATPYPQACQTTAHQSIAEPNNQLWSGCSRTGTASSNSFRSANESPGCGLCGKRLTLPPVWSEKIERSVQDSLAETAHPPMSGVDARQDGRQDVADRHQVARPGGAKGALACHHHFRRRLVHRLRRLLTATPVAGVFHKKAIRGSGAGLNHRSTYGLLEGASTT